MIDFSQEFPLRRTQSNSPSEKITEKATTMPPSIEIIFGAFPMNSYSPETREEFLKLLEEYNVKTIDTAYGYVSVTFLLIRSKNKLVEHELTHPADRFRENPRGTRRSSKIHYSYKSTWVPTREVEEGEPPCGHGEVVARFES